MNKSEKTDLRLAGVGEAAAQNRRELGASVPEEGAVFHTST